jgi:chromosomal replication initiator protein DnaA
MIQKFELNTIQVNEKEVQNFTIKDNLPLEEKEDLIKLYQYIRYGFHESAYFRFLKVIKYAGIRRERGAFILLVPDLLVKNVILQSYFKDIASFVSKNCKTARKIEITVQSDYQAECEEKVEKFTYKQDKNLNFETFFSSSSNKLAYWSARQTSEMIVKREASPLPCLCIFGSVGMGKTHLMKAIVSEVKRLDPHCKIEYLSAEDFRERYFRAIRENNLYYFKEYFSSLDALVLDDVQFLCSGSNHNIERDFARILNQLIDNRRWIVLACDKPPQYLKFDPRTQARITSGLKIAIEESDLDLRLMVLQAKLHELHQKDGLELSLESLHYIAEKVLSSIRSLESLLHIIVSHARATKSTKIQESTIRDLVTDHAIAKIMPRQETKTVKPSFNKLLDKVASFYELDRDEILSGKRLQSLSRARSLVAYISRNELSMTLKEIGLKLGRNHATIIHLLKAVEKNPIFLQEVKKIVNFEWKKI